MSYNVISEQDEYSKINSQYINLSNTTIKYNSDNIFSISNNSSNSSKELVTRMNTSKQFISINNSIISQVNNINEFNLLVNLYRTREITGTQYYSIKLNVNSILDTLLVLKPYYSYTFNISKLFVLKDVNNLLYKLQNINVSFVSVDDNQILSSEFVSIINTDTSVYSITVNIPENSDIYIYNKIYLKLTCELVSLDGSSKLKQGYFPRNTTGNAYIAQTNEFIEYLPIIIDKKSVIHNDIIFKNNNYYINNFINKINIYNYYTNIFNITNVENFDINISSNSGLSIPNIYKYKNSNKIIIYSDKNLYKNFDISTNITSHNIILKNIFTELLSTNINNDSKYIIYLYENYEGNDSSNDYENSNQVLYRTKYIGEPGFNGELIYNLNKVLDFNISVNNILQNILYINNITYFDHNIDKYQYYNDLLSTSSIYLVEPIKLKLMYQVFNTETYIDLPNYSYSPNFFPGKSGSKLTIQIPHDIDGDNIFNENIKLVGIGHYSNQIVNSINIFVVPSNIYVLPQYNSTIFINITNNTIIRLPVPNYSLEYKFIIINSSINSNNNSSYTLTLITNNSIFGYIDEAFNKNIELKNNNKLIFKNITKGNSFILTSNKENYYLENISINRNTNTSSSLINFNKNTIYLPNKNSHKINVNVSEERFILEDDNINIEKLYKNTLYNFSTLNLSTNYFNLVNLDVLNLNKIDISHDLFLNNYNNLYYIFETNTPLLTDDDFNTYVENNHNFNINVNINNNTILFNNSSSIPIIYSNYIYKFIKPLGFFILNNFDFSEINSTPTMSISDYINISHNYYDITVRKNDIIKHTISSELNNITVVNNQNNTLNILNDNFKNLAIDTLIYFNSDIYHSYDNTITNLVKIISKNTLYNVVVSDSNNNIILKNVVFNNNDNPILSINNNSIDSISNVKAYLFRNSINYNTHKLFYIYYKQIVINDTTNILKILETNQDGIVITHDFIIEQNNYNTYSYSINGENLYTEFLPILQNSFITQSYTLSIENDRYKIFKPNVEFNIIETPLSILLGFNTIKSKNDIIYGVIPNINNTFETSDYYKYYGKKNIIDYNTLTTFNSNSLISIDLEEDKHINLPNINEGLIYTFIVNNSIKNKKLYIHSFSKIYNLDNNTFGNILVLKPQTNLNLNICISISSNDNKYFINDIKGHQYTLNLYMTKIYNNLNNFSNLYYTETGIANIDKYMSVFDIHVVGLRDDNNTIINEQKFLHVVKTLARILDNNQTNTVYDNNIHNSILNKNSYILLYNNNIPQHYFNTTKHIHENNIYIKYSDININYDYTREISELNKYDITLEKIINLLINNYVDIYPHIFSYNQFEGSLENLNIYKYVDNNRISSSVFINNDILNTVYIIDNSLNINEKVYSKKYYNTNVLNYSCGSDLTIRLNNLVIKYENTILKIKYSLDIINIGKGYKNNDKVFINIDSNIQLILTLNLIDLSNVNNLYNVYNSYNQINNSLLNNTIINELINDNPDSIYSEYIGDITTSETINYNININDILYDKNLDNKEDLIKYVSNLLLALLGYYKLRNIKNNSLSYLDFKIITPTLVKKYNNKFVGLYLSSSLRNIKNLNNIHTYNLDLLNYIKSDNSDLFDLDLKISNISVISDFNNLIKTYDNITPFNNALDFTIIKNNQYATINFTATKTQNNITENLPIITNIINNNTNNTIIDVSSIQKNDYYNTDVYVNINIQSEAGNSSIYNFSLNRSSVITDITSIKNINIFSDDLLIQNISNINDNSKIIYFKENQDNIIEIILDNIYSNIEQILINNTNILNDNLNILVNNYSYKYVFTPNYYSSTLNLDVKSENSTSKNYILNLLKYPNNIALLDDVIITNISNINKFDSYNFNYNGILNKNTLEIFNKNIITLSDDVSNISLNIKKTDIYSSVNTTIEYYDGNNTYIVYKDTNELFIHDILTFVKDYNSNGDRIFKTHVLNEDHTFYNEIPIISYNSNDHAFLMDVASLSDYNNNANIFDFIENNSKMEFINKSDPNNISTNTELNQMFDINNEYEVVIDKLATGTDDMMKKIKVDFYQGDAVTLPSNTSLNDVTINLENTFMLIESKPFKKIQNDNTKELLNISNISNIKINIKVTSEDKTVVNNYVYIINTK